MALLQHRRRQSDALQLDGDEKIGSQIVRRAIEHPLKQLCANAGVDGGVVVKEVLSSKGNQGYNVATGQVRGLRSRPAVVDPTKVTRTALRRTRRLDRWPPAHDRVHDHRDPG